ncbi:MAG: prepilin-type N-terminal cleavage/methylation domain-containing protein [Candidatus Gracilibacteria bacterium]|nr:prepilin-type N-terminal cleavage/methylation domain-containing protein [Candidatus Gracilibacteria bacterium]
MFKLNKKGFTLIELMVTITIVAILMMMTYAPYQYYSNKAKVRITARDISQVLTETRNLAVHGLDKGTGNLSLGVYFDSTDSLKNKVQVFSFPHNYEYTQILPDESDPNVNLIKTVKLKAGVEIDRVGGQNNGFFVFESITGEGTYSYFQSSKQNFSDVNIDIEFSYKDSANIKNKITYITKTNISDY